MEDMFKNEAIKTDRRTAREDADDRRALPRLTSPTIRDACNSRNVRRLSSRVLVQGRNDR